MHKAVNIDSFFTLLKAIPITQQWLYSWVPNRIHLEDYSSFHLEDGPKKNMLLDHVWVPQIHAAAWEEEKPAS